MKTLNLNLAVSLPSGEKINLASHRVNLSPLEAYAVEALTAASGGKLDVAVEASVSESA